MFLLALQTLRVRWISFMSMFAALGLGVALIGAAFLVLFATSTLPPQPPERFSAAQVVVRPAAPTWASSLSSVQQQDIARENGLPSDIATQLAAIGASSSDRSFYAQIAGSNASQVGHPWSSAAFAAYALDRGEAPRQNNEIVVGAGVADLNAQVIVRTASEQSTYRVVGIVVPQAFESALFFSDAEAARLSPRIDAIVSAAPGELVQQVVAGRAEVLTGQERNKLDPTLAQKTQALNNIAILTSIAGGIAGYWGDTWANPPDGV
jgi:putative ABC transport system permease protein